MGWAIGYDERWHRDIGYGVPAFCDHPGCGRLIDRGLACVCGGEPHGGDKGCGLYFCEKHLYIRSLRSPQLCDRCQKQRKPFAPTPDTVTWLRFKMTDPSWARWRRQQLRKERKASEEHELLPDSTEQRTSHAH